ncbi:Hypothetical protein LUCI_3299 [Lucifera butyrica]|uniref:Uncharacterized protein n=1 Tax=Lucifera butyrica TaxID=1351585 RepID=A0A498R930_9FIRM|nr:Hypothetical protein LUCI_3299 [Lucifera butyrica]
MLKATTHADRGCIPGFFYKNYLTVMEPILYNKRKMNRNHPAQGGVEVRATEVLSGRVVLMN